MTKSIRAENIGPVDNAIIPLDSKGGVTILRGFNGSGKDSLLEAVGKMTGGKQSISCKDGAAKGSIEGLGIRLTIGKKAHKSGECEALSLTGKFDLSDFVDPPIKDAETADRYRLKALLTIRGVDGDMDAFKEILPEGSDLAAIVSGEAMAERNIVEQARLIKTDLERKAREVEDSAEKSRGKAEGARNATGDVPANAEYDEDAKTAELEAAVTNKTKLTSQAEHYRTAQEQAAKAQKALNDADAGPSLAECEALLEKATQTDRYAREKLVEARENAAEAKGAYDAAVSQMSSAKRESATVEGWHDSIEAAQMVDPVEDVFIEDAIADVETIRHQVQQGAVIREAIRQHREAERCDQEARDYDKTAEGIRGAARGTDDVLSGLVASGRIRVEAGRLMVDHDKRGATLFAELSKGEKWRLALLEAVDRLREIEADGLAIIPIPQQAWEGLDPSNRAEIWREARRLKVSIVAAECDAGALRAELFEPSAELQAVKDEPVKVAAPSKPKAKPAVNAKKKPAPEAKKTPTKPVNDEIDFS